MEGEGGAFPGGRVLKEEELTKGGGDVINYTRDQRHVRKTQESTGPPNMAPENRSLSKHSELPRKVRKTAQCFQICSYT